MFVRSITKNTSSALHTIATLIHCKKIVVPPLGGVVLKLPKGSTTFLFK
jgi:hypothetical protein